MYTKILKGYGENITTQERVRKKGEDTFPDYAQ